MDSAFDMDEQVALFQLLLDALSTNSGSDAGSIDSSVLPSDMIVPSFDHPDSLFQSLLPMAGAESGVPVSGFTTIMIRNIPKKCTQRMLLGDIASAGFGEGVDFLYLPTDISSGKNLGYAFVNFVRPACAQLFREQFHKRHLQCMRGSRAGLSVSFAVIQGFHANVENVLKNASVHRIKNPEYLPLVLNKETQRLGPCCVSMDIKRRHSSSSTQSSPQMWTDDSTLFTPSGFAPLRAH